jgi:hypothetical protein
VLLVVEHEKCDVITRARTKPVRSLDKTWFWLKNDAVGSDAYGVVFVSLGSYLTHEKDTVMNRLLSLSALIVLLIVVLLGQETQTASAVLTVDTVRAHNTHSYANLEITGTEARSEACRTYSLWGFQGGLQAIDGTDCGALAVEEPKMPVEDVFTTVPEIIEDSFTTVPPTITVTPEMSTTPSVPTETPVVVVPPVTETPVVPPVVVTPEPQPQPELPVENDKEKCNKGEGNGSEGCDPGNNPDKGNDDENDTHPSDDNKKKDKEKKDKKN